MRGRYLVIVTVVMSIGIPFAQKASVPRQADTRAIASEKVRELLALMDPDKNGKISKSDWMKFMEAQFDRLDKNKKGEIDPKELLWLKLSHVPSETLGK